MQNDISSKDESKMMRKVFSLLILLGVFLYCFPQIREELLGGIQRTFKYLWGEE